MGDMIFPSPDVERAVEASKDFLDWMVAAEVEDFEEAWKSCDDPNAMFKLLLTLNPQSKGLHWVAFRAASRAAQGVEMDLDEQVLEHFARKLDALERGDENYDGEAALSRAIALNRIVVKDDAPRPKSLAQMAIGWACCKSARSCGMALDAAFHSERVRFLDDKFHIVIERSYQVVDIHELFPLPLTMSKIRYPSRYERPWVI